MPYFQYRYEFWTGFYSSSASLKKEVKAYSKLLHALSRVYARRMINKISTDEASHEGLKVTWDTLDSVALL